MLQNINSYSSYTWTHWPTSLHFNLFLSVLGFGFMALCFLGKCCTTWAIPPSLFAFSYFSDRVSQFSLGLALDYYPPAYDPPQSWDYSVNHCSHFHPNFEDWLPFIAPCDLRQVIKILKLSVLFCKIKDSKYPICFSEILWGSTVTMDIMLLECKCLSFLFFLSLKNIFTTEGLQWCVHGFPYE
jgi:hypothetical protein